MAPIQFQEGISRFLEGHPYDQNVFCMTRYAGEGKSLSAAVDVCRTTCAAHGLELHLASDRSAEDLLLPNVAASMWACRYGIVLLEALEGEGLNYNAVFETGAMLMTGRRCLLLKDKTAPKLPTNLVGHIYKSIDLADLSTLERAVSDWITADLDLA
jgi:hypothetical protein